MCLKFDNRNKMQIQCYNNRSRDRYHNISLQFIVDLDDPGELVEDLQQGAPLVPQLLVVHLELAQRLVSQVLGETQDLEQTIPWNGGIPILISK